MKEFGSGVRVKVKDGVKDYAGCVGTAVRCTADGTAWVQLDKWPAKVPRLFNDKSRKNYVRLAPEQVDQL